MEERLQTSNIGHRVTGIALITESGRLRATQLLDSGRVYMREILSNIHALVSHFFFHFIILIDFIRIQIENVYIESEKALSQLKINIIQMVKIYFGTQK